MEIYVAISDFKPPIVDGSQNILEFLKGDKFEIFDCHKTDADWWGARALKTNIVGYVPSRYMQYEEKRIGKLLPSGYKWILGCDTMYHIYTSGGWYSVKNSHGPGIRNQKETSLKRLSDIQNNPNHKAPEEVIPDTPVPDYQDAATQENQNVFKFAKKFETVLTNIQKIEDMYNDNMEPEPDYHDELDNITIETENKNKERTPSQSSDEGLIQPRKLPNPCVESPTRQALHKELLLNYKRGVNVLEKPELSKVLQNRRETQRRKEWEEQVSSKRTSLEMKLEQRATRLKEDEMKTIKETEDDSEKPELHKAFAKFAQKSNGQVK